MSPAPIKVEFGRPRLHAGEGDPSADSPYPKCSLLLRGLARAVDLVVAWGMFVVGERVGALAALLFLLFADGMIQGQSIGKRLFGVKVVYVPTRQSGRYRDSVLRNAPLGLIVLLSTMPAPLGPFAFVAGVVVIGGIEAWKVWRHPLGLRLGDVWAQTQVVDGKVVAGTPELVNSSDAPVRAAGKAYLRREKCESR